MMFSTPTAFLAGLGLGAAAGIAGVRIATARRRRSARAVLTFSMQTLIEALARLGRDGDLPYRLMQHVAHATDLARAALRVAEQEVGAPCRE